MMTVVELSERRHIDWSIVVGVKEGISDRRGERVKRDIRDHLGIALDRVRTLDVYTVDAQLGEADVIAAAAGPFSDPVIQEYAVNRPLAHDFDVLIEVGYRPGVTDNVGRTAREAIEYQTKRAFTPGEAVYTSVQYLLSGTLSMEEAERVARDFLANQLIQRWTIVPAALFDPDRGVPITVPKVAAGSQGSEVREIDLNVADSELMQISRDGMLALTLNEMKTIQAFYQNEEVVVARRKVGL